MEPANRKSDLRVIKTKRAIHTAFAELLTEKDMDDINRTAAEYLKEALEEALLEYRRPGDTILVKASHFMGFSEIVKKLEQPQ